MSYSGDLDLTGTSAVSVGVVSGAVGSDGTVVIGPNTANAVDVFTFASIMPEFSVGVAQVLASSGSGDAFGLHVSNGAVFLLVPSAYDGSLISGASIFESQTVNSLGLLSGDYTYTMPSSDEVSLSIVPEPSVGALMLGLLALGYAIQKRR